MLSEVSKKQIEILKLAICQKLMKLVNGKNFLMRVQ